MSTVPQKTENIETPFCQFAQSKVAIETTTIYPVDLLPDSPRVTKRTCSHYSDCMLLDKSACPEHLK